VDEAEIAVGGLASSGRPYPGACSLTGQQRLQAVQVHGRQTSGNQSRTIKASAGRVFRRCDQCGDSGSKRRGEAGAGILDRDAMGRIDRKRRQRKPIDFRIRLLVPYILTDDDRRKPICRAAGEHIVQQRCQIDAAGRRRDPDQDAPVARFFDEPGDAGTRHDGAARDKDGIDRVLADMEGGHAIAVAGDALLAHIAGNAFAAAAGGQQVAIVILRPMPFEPGFRERLIERGAVRVLALDQRAVDVEEDRLERQRSAFRCFGEHPAGADVLRLDGRELIGAEFAFGPVEQPDRLT